MRHNTPSNKLIRGSRCPCPIGGSRRACGAGRASSRRAEQSSRHGQQAGGQASVPVGGGRAWLGFETTRQANDQQPSAGGVEAAAGPAGPGRGAGGRRQGQGGLSGRAKLRPVGGCRGACGAWPRCRRAAAGPGRASRRRAKRTISNQAPSVWRQPQGLRGMPRCRWAAAGPGLDPRRRTEPHVSDHAPLVWRAPVGGGRDRADYPTALSTARLEAAAGPAGPGRASRRRAERSSRRGRRAGGQAPRRPEIRQCHKRSRRPAVPQAPPESQNSS